MVFLSVLTKHSQNMFGRQNGDRIYFQQQSAALERYQQGLGANIVIEQPAEAARAVQLDDDNRRRQSTAAVSTSEHLARGPEAPHANVENNSQRRIPQNIRQQPAAMSGTRDDRNQTPRGSVLNNCHIGNFYSITATGSGAVNIPAPNPTPRTPDFVSVQRPSHRHHHHSDRDAEESSSETTSSSPSPPMTGFRSQPPWSPILTRRTLFHAQRRPDGDNRSSGSGSSTSLGSVPFWRRSPPSFLSAYRDGVGVSRPGPGPGHRYRPASSSSSSSSSSGHEDRDGIHVTGLNSRRRIGNNNNNNDNLIGGDGAEGNNSADSDTLYNDSVESIV
ncbi:hypothetical protein VTJ83DRAFT_2462 [Remersonia thermophila]|uniref:Uncharacterized protein n=1 Tax=Remersonia thermophila TaxID=72144 RepID=A0ABR4DIT3_9PEZI